MGIKLKGIIGLAVEVLSFEEKSKWIEEAVEGHLGGARQQFGEFTPHKPLQFSRAKTVCDAVEHPSSNPGREGRGGQGEYEGNRRERLRTRRKINRRGERRHVTEYPLPHPCIVINLVDRIGLIAGYGPVD